MIAASFAEDCRGCAAALEGAAERNDWETVRREAHKLKGIFLQYGVKEGEPLAVSLCSRMPDESSSPNIYQLSSIARRTASEMERIVGAV